MNIVCLITFRPNAIWCNFLNVFTKYRIFMIVDDNNYDTREFQTKYRNIIFVKVENTKCETSGYVDTNFTLKKLISGWDKALYYFGVENKNFDSIWFIEDDVFFHSENTLLKIDQQYTYQDLLSNNYATNGDGNKRTWLWNKITIQKPPVL